LLPFPCSFNLLGLATKRPRTFSSSTKIFSTARFIFEVVLLKTLKGERKLPSHRHISVEDADFIFENRPLTVVANRNEAEIELAGLSVGPFEEGKEYEVRFWVAQELQRAGIVRFREEDTLDVVKLHKTHWKERVQPSNKVSPLPEEFYPRLRRYLVYLENASSNNSERMRDYEKSLRISRDVVNCRVKKIVSLASSPPLTAQRLQSLTPEERTLYHRLHRIISEWRRKILEERGGEK
jgi:hypothetical protein